MTITPDLSSELSQRQWLWLTRRVGGQRAQAAIEAAVRRGRRPYVINAARELGLSVPKPNELPFIRTEQGEATARQHLAALRSIVGINRDL